MIIANSCRIMQILQMGKAETGKEAAMNVMHHQQVEREAQRMQANREELIERIGRVMRTDGTIQPLSGLCWPANGAPIPSSLTSRQADAPV